MFDGTISRLLQWLVEWSKYLSQFTFGGKNVLILWSYMNSYSTYEMKNVPLKGIFYGIWRIHNLFLNFILDVFIAIGIILTTEAGKNNRKKHSNSRLYAVAGIALLTIFPSCLISVFKMKMKAYPIRYHIYHDPRWNF